LINPVISSTPVKKWLTNGAAAQWQNSDTAIVSFIDSIWTYNYVIYRPDWLIVRLVKLQDYAGTLLSVFNAQYHYLFDSSGIPILQKISYNNDTTLAMGGYRFFNISINDSITDSLFVADIRYSLCRRNSLLKSSILPVKAVDLAGRIVPIDLIRGSLNVRASTLVYSRIASTGFIYSGLFQNQGRNKHHYLNR
jgi:hypothetical protein